MSDEIAVVVRRCKKDVIELEAFEVLVAASLALNLLWASGAPNTPHCSSKNLGSFLSSGEKISTCVCPHNSIPSTQLEGSLH